MPVSDSVCPECGAALRGRPQRRICPRCVLRVSLSDDGESGESPDRPPAETAAPRRFGDYELLRELGRGGMGVVYEARHLSLNRVVALKMLHPSRLSSAAQLQRFRQEAEAVAALDHPNILPVYEVGAIQGQPYFTMKIAEQGNLADAAARPPADADASNADAGHIGHQVSLLAQIARAVHYAHQRGIQHRDLKPHNILLDAGGRPFVADFGLAKFAKRESNLTLSTEVMGSPAYMSPEQASGDTRNLTTASDVYGLGAIMYELLAGEPPFSGDNVPQLLRRIVEDEPDGSVLGDPDLRTVCLKCLHKNPDRRYPSAEALAEELDRWQRGEPVLARPASGLERAARWCRRKPALAMSLAALLLALVAGVIGIAIQWRRAEEHAFHRDVERYAADLQVASQALAGHDLGLARRMLAAQIPGAGQTDLRGFEWQLLQDLSAGRQLNVLTGHTATITCAAFSPDGRLAVSGGMDASIRLWRLPTGEPLATLPAHGTVVWSVAFTPDGQRIISAGADGSVRFWTPDGRSAGEPLEGVNAALSGDGTLLAASMSAPFRYFKAQRGIKVWDWRARRVVFETNVVARRVALSPDGQWLAAGGERQGIHLWNLATREGKVIEAADSPWSLKFSPDGTRLAAAGFNLGARVWNLPGDLSSPLVLGGHQFKVWAIDFSPDGRRVVTCGSDRTLQIRNLNAPDRATVLDGHDDEIWDVCWNPGGTRLLTASKDMTLRLWPAETVADAQGIPNREHWSPQFSATGTKLLTLNDAHKNQVAVTLRSLADGAAAATFDNRWIAGFDANGEDVILLNDESYELERWRAASGGIAKGARLERRATPQTARGFALSRDGSTIALSFDREVVAWNLTDGRLRATAALPEMAKPLALALSPHARYLAYSVSSPYTIWLLDLRTGHTIELIRHTEEVKGLTFSPDDETLASAGVDRIIRLWRTGDGSLKGELVRYFEEASGVSFSPDGRLLASVGVSQSVNLWHLPTLREVMSIPLPEAQDRIAFSPAGDAIAVTAEPNVVRIFQTGR